MVIRRRSINTTLVGTVAVLGLVLAGCSSSHSPASSGSKGSASGSEGSASPIVIGTEMPLSGPALTVPQLKAGMDAAVSAVNAEGGIHGHPLQLKTCDTKFEVNVELSCTRSLINSKVAAIVGGLIAADQSGREFELASKAHIPYIGPEGLVQAEFTTPGVFPLSAGTAGWVVGAVKNLIAKGAKEISIFALNTGNASQNAQLANATLASTGMKAASTVLVDADADPTFSSAAAKATANGADGVFVLVTPDQAPKSYTALRNAGFKGLISTVSPSAAAPILKAAGSAAEGLLVTALAAPATDVSNPGIKSFLADMHKYQPKADIQDLSTQGWSAIKLFAKVLSGASGASSSEAPTSEQILAAFNGITTPIQLGTIGPFGPPPAKPYVPGYDRIFSPTVNNGVVKNGVLQPDGKGFVNPFVG
jgi:branched-chain amino acid transport system substrate-binding protein